MTNYFGQLDELTWTNKSLHLLAHEDGTYEWVSPSDCQVAEAVVLGDRLSPGYSHSEQMPPTVCMSAQLRTLPHPPSSASSNAAIASGASLPSASLLDVGALPIDALAEFANREANRPRPVYSAHRWFARRFGTGMRALLVGAVTPADGDFWAGFYGHNGISLSGLHLLDPFVGGGTIAYEAQRLGATVTGVDVDPVACAITRFELQARSFPDPSKALDEIWQLVGHRLAGYYRTWVDGEERIGLHYLWVQQVSCSECGATFDAHPSHLLGIAGNQAWVVCPACGDVHTQHATADTVGCGCGCAAKVHEAAAAKGTVKCPFCGSEERLINFARRTQTPPHWRMFAVESIPLAEHKRVPIADRIFHSATDHDLTLFQTAVSALVSMEKLIPRHPIQRTGRSDSRLIDYGYQRYSELFNARQLLHLVTLAKAIRNLDEPYREMLGLALSNHLLSNCMLTSYTSKWRQATPLFVVRSYRHSPRPVELNPWLTGVGRGTFPNAVRKVAAAIAYIRDPVEYTHTGFTHVASMTPGNSTVINGDARDLATVSDQSVDLVVTDPPYLDNIAYSELADFFVPWLADTGVLATRRRPMARANLATTTHDIDASKVFAEGLTLSLTEVHRVLRPQGRLIFTFQHHSFHAWLAIAKAICRAGFAAVNLLPIKGDGDRGLHHHPGSSTWDAVFVLRPTQPITGVPALVGDRHLAALDVHVEGWASRLALSPPDREVFYRAALAAGAAGFLAPVGRASLALETLAERGHHAPMTRENHEARAPSSRRHAERVCIDPPICELDERNLRA